MRPLLLMVSTVSLPSTANASPSVPTTLMTPVAALFNVLVPYSDCISTAAAWPPASALADTLPALLMVTLPSALAKMP